jgi:hypothetical protein
MGDDDRVQPGYDYWAAQIGTGEYWNPRKNINGKMVDLKGYDTNIVTDQAIEFMRANQEKPFCIWLAYRAPHGPFTPAPGHENDFADVELKPPPSFFADDPGKPKRIRDQATDRKALAKWAEKERNQYRALMGVEDSVGRLLAFLDENKLLDNPGRAWKSAAFTQLQHENRIFGHSVRNDRYRYIVWQGEGGGEELYDHQDDPGEFQNLAPLASHRRVLEMMRKTLATGWKAARAA